MTDRDLMQQALEALVLLTQAPTETALDYADNAIDALRERLAQQEQEPVALPCCGYADASAIKWNPYNKAVQCHNCGQTYTAPPQRKPQPEPDGLSWLKKDSNYFSQPKRKPWAGLTDEEKAEIWSNNETAMVLTATEAKLKEKNT